MKAFLTWISRLYPLVVLAHDFPENVSRWAAPKYKMSRTTQQIFPLIQHWGEGRGMSFRKDTVSGDIFLHFAFFTSFKSIFWHRIHVRDTLGTRDFFSRVTWSFVGRRPTRLPPSAKDTSGEAARLDLILRLDRNRKPRMKSLWHPGYIRDVRPWSSVSCLTSNKSCNRMQLACSVSTPKKDNAHSQHCPAFFCHGAYEEKLFNSQDIDFIWGGNFFNEGNWKFASSLWHYIFKCNKKHN